MRNKETCSEPSSGSVEFALECFTVDIQLHQKVLTDADLSEARQDLSLVGRGRGPGGEAQACMRQSAVGAMRLGCGWACL